MRPLPAVLVISLATLSCDNPTKPTATREIEVCLFQQTSWGAFQNEGGQWTHFGSGPGVHRIQVTDRVAIARGVLDPDAPSLSLYYVSADQAAQVFRCVTGGGLQTRALSGSVQGLPVDSRGELTIGPTWMSLLPTAPNFTLPYGPVGTFDLIAARWAPTSEHVDRLIVRRGQSHPSGSIPLLDFDGVEAIVPAASSLTWTGPRAHVQVNFHGLTGNNQLLLSTVVGELDSGEIPRSTVLYSVPPALQLEGEVHELFLGANDREMTLYYSQADDRSLALGPIGEDPTFTDLASSSNLRVRVEVPVQAEYGGWFNVYMNQRPHATDGGLVSLTATREYFGVTPSVWSITMPDFAGVEGFQSTLGLKPGVAFDWQTYVTSRVFSSPELPGVPGDLLRSARRSGVR